jgi:multiple sugar transport system permease protein
MTTGTAPAAAARDERVTGARPRLLPISERQRQISEWSLAILVVVVASLVPVVWIVMLSLKTPATVTDGSFIPHKWTLANYSDIFKAGIFTDALRNSIGIALIATALAVLIASAAAYAIARLDFPGKRIILAVSLGVAMFPQISLVGPLYNLWRQVGLYDTWPGLIIPYMTFALPLAIYTLSAFFRDIPWELEQAAQIDGATPFQAFRKVIAPLAMPGIVTTFIIVFIICWNDFVFAISLTSTSNAQTVPAAISTFPGVSQFTVPFGDIAAAAVVVTVPVMVLVLLFQRRIVAGLTAGAVKG